jgi:uncharacterized membrane protein (UPF0127 family)
VAARTGARIAVVAIAARPIERMIGLLRQHRLAPDAGLVLRPCTSVHTWFMRFSIDVVFLDREGTVVRIIHTLEPFRMASGGRGAREAVELVAGAARRFGLAAGDVLRIDPV